MNIKKIIKAFMLSIIVFCILYFGINNALPVDIASAISNTLSDTIIISISILFGIAYLINSYRLPVITENDIPMKKFEYFFNQCDDSLKKELDSLSDEDKQKYVVSTESLLNQENKTQLNNFIFNLTVPQKSSFSKSLGRIILLILTVCLGCITYQVYIDMKPFISEYNERVTATYDDQVIYFDNLPPINLISNNSFNQIKINDLVNSSIQNQPNYLLEKAENIYIYSSDCYNANINSTSDGLANPNTLSIHIKYSIQKDMSKIISHELWHLVDYAYGYLFYSNSDVLQSLYNDKPSSITDYGSTSPVEFFAEAGALYVNYPDELKRKNIDVFNYFEDTFGDVIHN